MLQENNRTEFKAELNDKLEKEIVAFLNNREGGILYIGVDDSGKPVGISNMDDTQLRIADRIKNNILPSPLGLFDIVTDIIENIPVIKVFLKVYLILFPFIFLLINKIIEVIKKPIATVNRLLNEFSINGLIKNPIITDGIVAIHKYKSKLNPSL